MRYVILIAIAFLLVSCSNKENEAEPSAEEKTNEVAETEEHVAGNFRNIDIKVENNRAKIEGEAQATDDTFYYQVEQDGSFLVEETQVTLEETTAGWGKFEFELVLTDEITDQEESPIVTFYVKNEDGEIINPNYVPIDLK